jgi:membrane protease YdiL (CAAX protease family)
MSVQAFAFFDRPAFQPRRGSLRKSIARVSVGGREYGMVLLILLGVTRPPLIITIATGERSADSPSVGQLVPLLLLFFVVQFLGSATEEVGWRGYLAQKLLSGRAFWDTGRAFWDTGWAVGLVWAVWHLPVVLRLFVQQGMVQVQTLSSLIGFGISIVAMSILQAWFYERTRSVFLSMIIHALFSTIPLTIVLLWEGPPPQYCRTSSGRWSSSTSNPVATR